MLVLVALLATLGPGALASANQRGHTLAGVERLPNLVSLPPDHVQLARADGSGLTAVPNALRFDATIANRGDAHLDVHAVPRDAAEADAFQCVRWVDDRLCSERAPAGRLEWHAEHAHYHMADFALYELRSLVDDEPDMSASGLVASTDKVSFCLMDYENEPNAGEGFYFTCNQAVQGISRGWRDRYEAHLPGQQIDLTGVPAGRYALVVSANPLSVVHEATTDDNVAFSIVEIVTGGCRSARVVATGMLGTANPDEANADLPNLVPLPAYDMQVGLADGASFDADPTALRFSVAIANEGAVSLDILGVPTGSASADAYQCVRWIHDRVCETRERVGQMEWHATHNHFHMEALAVYELRRLSGDAPDMSPAGLIASSGKVSFCLIDYESDGSEDAAFYQSCATPVVQGISPGWRDVYDQSLDGQQIDLAGIPDGRYALVVTVNPDAILREATDTDNVAYTAVEIGPDGCPSLIDASPAP